MDGTSSTERVTSQRVTVAKAAAILGVSVVTVRRMIRRGDLEAERVIRPQGSTYLVTLPADGTAPSEDGTSTGGGARDMSRADGTPTALMAAWSESFLAPLVARLGEQEAVIRDQAETIGRQGAELAAERERGKMHHAEAERARGELATAETFRRRNSRRLTIALAVAGTLAIVGVLAPAWVR